MLRKAFKKLGSKIAARKGPALGKLDFTSGKVKW